MGDGEILSTTIIADRWRISLVKDVREKLEEQGYDVEIGETIVYRFVDGNIVVEPNYEP